LLFSSKSTDEVDGFKDRCNDEAIEHETCPSQFAGWASKEADWRRNRWVRESCTRCGMSALFHRLILAKENMEYPKEVQSSGNNIWSSALCLVRLRNMRCLVKHFLESLNTQQAIDVHHPSKRPHQWDSKLQTKVFRLKRNIVSTSNDYSRSRHVATPSFMPDDCGSLDALFQLQKADSLRLCTAIMFQGSSFAKEANYDALHKCITSGCEQVVIHIETFSDPSDICYSYRLLQSRFVCIERLPCLAWGTDAADVTIWIPDTVVEVLLLHDRSCKRLRPCSQCHRAEAVKYCKVLPYVKYCCRDCFNKHEDVRYHCLRMAMVASTNFPLDFSDPHQFVSTNQ
jgi:hypothetical protein